MNKKRELLKNQINPTKLMLSKWTCLKVIGKEKHFIVTKVKTSEILIHIIEEIEIEAVISKRIRKISVEELKDQTNWLRGWK